MALDDAGRSGTVVNPHRLPERVHALGVGEAWRGGHQGELDERHVRLLDEDPRRLAARVLLDRHALPRRHGLAGDPREPQRLAVGDRDERERVAPVAPDRADVDGVPRRDAVELPARREPPFREVLRHVGVVRRVAEWHRDDPGAGRRLPRERLDALEHVIDRARAGQRRADRLEPLAVHVGMGVDQPRHDGPAAEVDQAGVAMGERPDLGGAAHGDDAVVGDRHGLREAEGGIDRDDRPAVEDQISGQLGERRSERARPARRPRW